MDSCKYTYSNYIGAGKSDHEKLMLRLDKLEKEEEAYNKEISESEKKRIREMNEIHNYFESLRPIKKRKTVKKLRWAPEETLKNIKEVENDETRGRSIEYAKELEQNLLGSSLSKQLNRDALMNRVLLDVPDSDKERVRAIVKHQYYKNRYEADDIIRELSSRRSPSYNKTIRHPKTKERFNINIPEFVGRAKPERIGGGNLIGRMERLSVENSKKPKKQLRWADGAQIWNSDPSWRHKWLPSEGDSSNIENVQEIDARSEGFDETRGKSYEHSYALEKEKPGSSQGWPPPGERWRKERAWFNTCLNEYRKNPYKNEKFEEYEKNRKEANEIIKELASKKSGGAVESPMETPPRVGFSIFSLLNTKSPKVESSEVGSDIIMGGEDDRTKVYDFVYETLSDKEIPVIIRVDRKIYLFSQSDIYRQLENGLVYGCYQANNLYTTCVPGQRYVDGTVCPSEPALPDGIKPGDKNVNENERLFSFQNLINRRIIVSFDKFKDLLLISKTTPICIGTVKTKKTVPSIAKLPFEIGVGKLHCNASQWKREMETIWELDTIKCNFTKEEEEILKEKFGDIYGKAPPELTPLPPSSPPPPSSNNTVRTYSTVHTMSDLNSPTPPPLNSDSSMEPRYSDETIRGRPSPLDIDETRRRLSFGDSDSEEDRSLNSAMNAVLTNAAHLREMQQEHNSPDSMFADESDADFRSPVSVEEMRNNARSPVYDRTRTRSPSPFDTPENRAIRQRTSRVPTTPPGSPPSGRPSRRFLRQEAMGEEPPSPPRLSRVTQEPDRRTSRLWAPLTPPPPLRARPRNRNNSNNDEDTEAVFARLPSSDASLSAQSDDSGMV